MSAVKLGPYPNGVDIRACIAATKERKAREEREAIEASGRVCLVATDLASLIYESGLAGQPLVQALHHHFATAVRADVFAAIGIAICLFRADIAIAKLEAEIMREASGRGVSA